MMKRLMRIKLCVLLALLFLLALAPTSYAATKTFYLHKDAANMTGNWLLNETAPDASADTNTQAQNPTAANTHVLFPPGDANSSYTSGTPPTAVAGRGWWSSTPLNGTFESGVWKFQLTTDDTVFSGSVTGHPVINVYRVPQNTSTSNAVLLFQLGNGTGDETADWWTADPGSKASVYPNKTGVGPFTFDKEFLLIEVYDNVTSISVVFAAKKLQVEGLAESDRSKLTTPNFFRTLESYNDSAHANVDNSFTSGESTVYMLGTGFRANGEYKVTYYDGGDTKRATETVTANSAGNLSSSHAFVSGTDVAGTWNVQVFNATLAPPSTYQSGNTSVLASDSFDVQDAAIPEFPAGMALPFVGSLIAYAFMRKKVRNGKD